MMHGTRRVAMLLLVVIVVFSAFTMAACAADDAPRITKEEVRPLVGDPSVIILDARTGGSWSMSDKKIKGAVRVDPADVGSWQASIPRGKKIVVYCS